MKYLMLAIGTVFIALLGSHKVSAAPRVNGITVSPAISQIDLTKNQTSSTFNITITNNTSSTLVISNNAEDFTTLNQNGGISFLSGTLDDGNAHGLASQLETSLPQITLSPGQSRIVAVSIENANKLAAGGHYSAVVFKAVNLSNTKGNNVTINYGAVSLIFLTTYGGGTQTLGLSTPGFGSFYAHFPRTVTAIFADQGNTQTTPRGVVQIYNHSSTLISQGVFNINSGLILPGSSRLFNLALSSQTTKRLWPGIYHAKIFYRHDGQNYYLLYQKSFVYINFTVFIVLIVIVLIVAFLLLLIFKKLKTKHRSKRL